MSTHFEREVNEIYSTAWNTHRYRLLNIYDNLSPQVVALIKRHDSANIVIADLNAHIARQNARIVEILHDLHIAKHTSDPDCPFCADERETNNLGDEL